MSDAYLRVQLQNANKQIYELNQALYQYRMQHRDPLIKAILEVMRDAQDIAGIGVSSGGSSDDVQITKGKTGSRPPSSSGDPRIRSAARRVAGEVQRSFHRINSSIAEYHELRDAIAHGTEPPPRSRNKQQRGTKNTRVRCRRRGCPNRDTWMPVLCEERLEEGRLVADIRWLCEGCGKPFPNHPYQGVGEG